MNREPDSPLRFVKWLALTFACALPLHVTTMGRALPPDIAGELLGIATWATGMTLLDSFLAHRRSVTKSRALTIGFSIWAAVHIVLAPFVSRAGSGVWAVPYVVAALPAWFLIEVFDGFHPRSTGEPFVVYVLTVSCGLFDFVAGLLVTRLVGALTRRGRSPPPDTAPSPAPPP